MEYGWNNAGIFSSMHHSSLYVVAEVNQETFYFVKSIDKNVKI